MLDIDPRTPEEEEVRFRSVLTILADARVVILPEGSDEPGRVPARRRSTDG